MIYLLYIIIPNTYIYGYPKIMTTSYNELSENNLDTLLTLIDNTSTTKEQINTFIYNNSLDTVAVWKMVPNAHSAWIVDDLSNTTSDSHHDLTAALLWVDFCKLRIIAEEIQIESLTHEYQCCLLEWINIDNQGQHSLREHVIQLRGILYKLQKEIPAPTL